MRVVRSPGKEFRRQRIRCSCSSNLLLTFKSKLIFTLSAFFALSVTTNGQDVPALKQVTLYSKMGHRDWGRASVRFDSGARGSTYWQLADFDLTYGTLAVNDDGDWFEVRDPRSMIVDLVAKQWGDFKETPSFFKSKKPRKPLPLSGPKEINTSAGVMEISPYQQFVRVKAGHMYLMKVVRERTKTYIMFRVDNLIKEDNCLLSWKKVPRPAEDLEK